MDKNLFQQNKSLRQISRETGKSLTAVRYWFHKYRLNIPPKLPIISDDMIRFAVSKAKSCAGALRILERSYVGSNYRFLQREIHRLKIPTNHWESYGRVKPRISLDRVLVENSQYHLDSGKRKRIINDGLLDYQCEICGLAPSWNGKPLTLRLDHRNGKNRDHRISNLRFLCPNCDSQLPTYCSKNRVYQRSINSTGLE